MSAHGAATQRPLTYHDLADTPDDGNRWEIIDGEVYASPFPTPAHQNVVTHLVSILYAHSRAHKLGRVFTSGLMVVLDEPTGVGPDVVFIGTDRLDGIREDGFHGAPDLVVEVLSSKPGLDRHVKRAKYARAGIPQYWIVDPVKRIFEVYRLEGAVYGPPEEMGPRGRFEPELFPGLVIELADPWL